ncbi:uncharacterized protein N7483_008452 [Penicillium malachiteum]|uniref:uncharacterized protein n=1 Tax=Penicillium malachiteum TaxID=1324776 RepID=UPI00254814F0|nr:uncharacterized protein N7483_008452 [Penicillium malachiteum]KAJ5720518.1 hypothetical protein N7483_008452 [Penicillium malachiteum]
MKGHTKLATDSYQGFNEAMLCTSVSQTRESSQLIRPAFFHIINLKRLEIITDAGDEHGVQGRSHKHFGDKLNSIVTSQSKEIRFGHAD